MFITLMIANWAIIRVPGQGTVELLDYSVNHDLEDHVDRLVRLTMSVFSHINVGISSLISSNEPSQGNGTTHRRFIAMKTFGKASSRVSLHNILLSQFSNAKVLDFFLLFWLKRTHS